MIVAQGHVADRPFARTLYAIAARRLSGDLILDEAGRRYVVGFDAGQVTAADSAAPADTVGRIALTAGLVTSSQIAQSLQVMAQTPGSDQLTILTEQARLSPDQVAALRRRVLAHRASRIFALADARFELHDQHQLQAEPVPPLDVRWLIFQGLRSHYSEARLDHDLAALQGRAVRLADDALGAVAYFGFGEAEKPILQALRGRPLTLDELCAAVPADRRLVLAVAYALVACDCLAVTEAAAAAAAPSLSPGAPASSPLTPATIRGTPLSAAAMTGNAPVHAHPEPAPATVAAGTTQPRAPLTAASIASQNRVRRITGAAPVGPEPTRPRSTTQAPATALPSAVGQPPSRPPGVTQPVAAPRAKPRTISPGDPAATEARRLIHDKLVQLDGGADHFAMLGIGQGVSAEEVRAAYFGLAKRLHPDRLRAVGVTDLAADSQRLFASINQAFAVLSDPGKRKEYLTILAAGGVDAIKRQEAEADALAAKMFGAEDAFRRGEMALRRNQFAEAHKLFGEAVQLQPDDAEHQVMLAWTTWLTTAEDERAARYAEIQRRINTAIQSSARCLPAHYYRGMIAKQAGKDDAAIEAFRRVLDLRPEHAEAALELRLLESRKAKKRDTGGGFFGRKK